MLPDCLNSGLNLSKCYGYAETSWILMGLADANTVPFGLRPQCLICQRETICGQMPPKSCQIASILAGIFQEL